MLPFYFLRRAKRKHNMNHFADEHQNADNRVQFRQNAPGAVALAGTAHGIEPAELRAALLTMLTSPAFRNAHRMCRLMRYLVETGMTGSLRDTSEYAIGVEVFDRRADYSTCEDPIVRVQVGRLRERLRVYYNGSGAQASLQFSIPVGSYMPLVRRTCAPPRADQAGHLLSAIPLLSVSADPLHTALTQGLSEELSFQLFKAFGQRIVSHTFMQAARSGAVRHQLEGSVRLHGALLRVSLRLVDSQAGRIAWSEQFDRTGPFGIAMHEALALAICSALKLHFELAQDAALP
jgi:TolB-like protein